MPLLLGCDCLQAQVAAALDYIEQHKEQVLAGYERILERERQGNPPELQAKLDKIRAECEVERAERKAMREAITHDQAAGR